jgi:hypothetical protein
VNFGQEGREGCTSTVEHVEETTVSLHTAGSRVLQVKYGTGTVTSVNEYHTVIDFDEAGTRTFITARVELTPSDTEAPVRAKKKAVRKKKVVVDVPVETPVDAPPE